MDTVKKSGKATLYITLLKKVALPKTIVQGVKRLTLLTTAKSVDICK